MSDETTPPRPGRGAPSEHRSADGASPEPDRAGAPRPDEETRPGQTPRPAAGAPESEDATPPADPGASPHEPSGERSGATARSEPQTPLTGRQRLVMGLWPPRVTRAQLIVALLLCVLGLGLAIQVRTTSDDNGTLRGARQEDLVRILTELDNRSQRLEDEKRGLEAQQSQLETSSNQAAEALRQTRQKEAQLGVLAGTVAAQGPGITLTITDPHGSVQADSLLDTLQELRAAGAEAIQINAVRVVAGTYLTEGSGGTVLIDGHQVAQPYVFRVIGNPQDLEPALNIPGGVVQTLEKEQATADVVRSQKIVVDALRPSARPDYARSSQ